MKKKILLNKLKKIHNQTFPNYLTPVVPQGKSEPFQDFPLKFYFSVKKMMDNPNFY